MSVALVFITHNKIAQSMISVAQDIVKKPSQNLTFAHVKMNADRDEIIASIESKLAQLDTSEGIIFVSDIIGGTPYNIAQFLADKKQASLLSGINLALVVCLFNYRDQPLDVLLDKAYQGAKKCIQKSSSNINHIDEDNNLKTKD